MEEMDEGHRGREDKSQTEAMGGREGDTGWERRKNTSLRF